MNRASVHIHAGMASSFRRRLALACAVGISVIALAPLNAAAEPGAPASPIEPTRAASKAAYDKQLVCTSRTPIGSRIARKSCTTRAQADAESANVEKTMRDMAREADRNAKYETGQVRGGIY